MNLEKELDVAKKIALVAGIEILKIYKTDFNVEYKLDNSPVTLADKLSNEIIVNELTKNFPSYSFLSEEFEDDLKRLENDWCWIIDPIDGTKEFVAKNGEFTINIGLSYKSKILLGVVFAPILNELYFAVKGYGAFLEKNNNIKKIKVSNKVENLTMVKSRTHHSPKLDKIIENNRNKIKNVMQVGSTLKGCLIAKGEADVYYRFGNTMEWDIAAVHCIIEEAGGIFRQLDDSEIIYNRKNPLNDKGFYILNNIENKLVLT